MVISRDRIVLLIATTEGLGLIEEVETVLWHLGAGGSVGLEGKKEHIRVEVQWIISGLSPASGVLDRNCL